ncbi:MAG: hypothetical protein JNM59_01595 [Hyphomonadaceae bacterium]|nr:hypothetical protein [Hyphomonadaceae bacterium]
MRLRFSRRECLAGGVALAALGAEATAESSLHGVDNGATLIGARDRAGIELSGDWAYSVDPYRDGLNGFHGASAGLGHRRFDDIDVDAYTRAHPNALFEYDMARAARARLPSAWMGHAPELRRYVGLMWYQRTFTVEGPVRGRAFIHVEGANYRTVVYVNGARVGGHEGGFTPFACEATTHLRTGENQITLAVDSEPSPETIPPPVTDWENYGGVTRPLRVVLTPETFIDDAWARLTRDGALAFSMRLNGPRARGRRVRARIPALGVTVRGRTGEDGCWHAETPAPPELRRWSPQSPTLYQVVFETTDDALSFRVGFRTVETRGEDILLNGEPIFLRGICLHEEEIGEAPVRNMTPEAAERLLRIAKDDLHCNFVRLAHYPHTETTVRLADEIGLMVWSEIPVYWRIDWESAETLTTARRMLAENIQRDRNRAAIILWSVGNETPLSEARNSFMQTLVADARRLDDSRLITAALLTNRTEEHGRPLITIDDPLAQSLDVLGVNTYNGWYSDDALSALPSIAWRSRLGKPMVFSEFGADALAGFHDPDLMRKFSEEFQADYYRQTLAMSESIGFLRGLSPWILKDFRSPRRQHPIYQEGWNRKGLISQTGVRKQAFAVLSEHYRQRANG